MRSFGIAILPIVALAACSSSTPPLGASSSAGTGGGTSGGGSATTGTTTTGTTTGPLTVTFNTIDVHPAAKAALANAGLPIPSLTNGDYLVALDGVGISLSGGNVSIVLTDAGVASLTSTTGPYVFALTSDFLLNHASLGVIGVVKLVNSNTDDAGGLPMPTCPEFAQITTTVNGWRDAGVQVTTDMLLDAGLADYLIPTGLEINGQASPPLASVTGAVAYAVPMSYAMMLNCAGNPSKLTHDTDIGEALVYITDGSGAGLGNPVEGAVTSLKNAAGTPPPSPTYYSNDYSSTVTTDTDATGVATYLDVSPAGQQPPTISINGASGLPFTQPYSISTQPNAFFSIVAYPH